MTGDGGHGLTDPLQSVMDPRTWEKGGGVGGGWGLRRGMETPFLTSGKP